MNIDPEDVNLTNLKNSSRIPKLVSQVPTYIRYKATLKKIILHYSIAY